MELYDEEYDENVIYPIENDPEPDEDEQEQQEEAEEQERTVVSFTKDFINAELSISVENAKTEVKFMYNNILYSGIIIKEFPSGNDNYIFLVECLDKNTDKKGKFMKKIHVPDATIVK